MNLDELVERVKGHTPGSWALRAHGAITGGTMRELVNGSVQPQIAMACAVEGGQAEQDANAALIAAAPSLLTLALELRKMLESIVQAFMACEDMVPCPICRPSPDDRHEAACPILAAERMLA